jgi:integrase
MWQYAAILLASRILCWFRLFRHQERPDSKLLSDAMLDFRCKLLVQDYIRPAALTAGILIERDGKLHSKEGDEVTRFGFHNLGRHSLATFLMDESENPAVVQAVMRHAQMDMTLYYSHSNKRQKRAALDNYAQHLVSAERVPVRVTQTIQ